MPVPQLPVGLFLQPPPGAIGLASTFTGPNGFRVFDVDAPCLVGFDFRCLFLSRF